MKINQRDAANNMETPQDITHYLGAVSEDGDSSLTATAIGDVVMSRGMTVIATESGLGWESIIQGPVFGRKPRILVCTQRQTGIRAPITSSA